MSLSVEKALEYATKKHSGQKRIGGEDYITHPVEVCNIVKKWGYGDEYQITALFHDLLEDTDATENEILELSNSEVLEAVKLLTKKKPCNMNSYISGIKRNKIAFVVKGADRLHNIRSAYCTSRRFRKKYVKETNEYYIDFTPEIKPAIDELEKSLDRQ